jgi:Regulator of ribonuclease activity B
MTTPHAQRDAKVRNALAEHGDSGRTPRHTVFYFYGGNFEALGKEAQTAGYQVRPTAKHDGVILEITTAVDEPAFRPHGSRMEAWASKFGAEYDGWECQLVKQ